MRIEREVKLQEHYEELRNAVNIEIDKCINIGKGKLISSVTGFKDPDIDDSHKETTLSYILKKLDEVELFLEEDEQYHEYEFEFTKGFLGIIKNYYGPIEELLPILKKETSERLTHFRF
jgi:hypothetical protein